MKALHSIALGFGLLFATAAVNAQGVSLRANIPFNFVVGNQALPAGQYVVQPGTAGSSEILTVRSWNNGKAASALTYACGGRSPAEKSELVFHRIGNAYFLSQIQVEGLSQGRQLIKNHTEAEAEAASNQEAKTVVIFAELVNR
jgi:hypothetical protein